MDWSISSAENGGATYYSGTANVTSTFISSNRYGYAIDELSATGLNAALSYGTYWLNIQNATSQLGDPIAWDENSGVGCEGFLCPSESSDSSVGTIPSEAFDVLGSCPGVDLPQSQAA